MGSVLYKFIGRHVIYGFMAMVFLLVILSSVSIFKLYNIHAKSEQLRTSYTVIDADLSNLRAGVGNLRRFEKDIYLNVRDQETYQKYYQRWKALYDQIQIDLKHLEAISDKPQVIESILPSFRQGLEFYYDGFKTVYKGILAGRHKTPEDCNQAILPYKQYVRQIDSSIKEAGSYLAASEKNLQRSIIDWRDGAITFVFVLSLITLLIAILITAAVFNATSSVAEEL